LVGTVVGMFNQFPKKDLWDAAIAETMTNRGDANLIAGMIDNLRLRFCVQLRPSDCLAPVEYNLGR